MKIVILDGYALNPGDLSYDCLKAFGELTVYEGTDSETEAIARIGDAEIVSLEIPTAVPYVFEFDADLNLKSERVLP